MPKTTRRESRETAFSLLFEWSFREEESLEEIIETAKLTRDAEVDSFALELLSKVIQNREELDSLIGQYSQGWKLKRISRTALAGLRMSFCEMTKLEDIPVGASINEAVELVKMFGTNEEATYINGILGSFERVRRGLEDAPAKQEEENAQEDNQDKQLNTQDIQEEHKPQTDKKPDDIELIEDIVIEVE
ncbi:MAG: transcription antitermination factor NusB [Oscillospiraceae bacterium]|nr:transcription antitermination factor NusB [Oscillospiraceae bacterium]